MPFPEDKKKKKDVKNFASVPPVGWCKWTVRKKMEEESVMESWQEKKKGRKEG